MIRILLDGGGFAFSGEGGFAFLGGWFCFFSFSLFFYSN
jgi:hypothetical protein